MKVKVSTENLGVVSDLYKAGHDECGTDIIGEAFFVGLSFPDGRNFAHTYSFKSYAVEYDKEEGVKFFRDVLEDAKAKAEALLSRMLAVGEVDLDCGSWNETYPGYGSEAYSNSDAIAWEQERGVGYDPANYGGIYG